MDLWSSSATTVGKNKLGYTKLKLTGWMNVLQQSWSRKVQCCQKSITCSSDQTPNPENTNPDDFFHKK